MSYRVMYVAEVETAQKAQEYHDFFETIPDGTGKTEIRMVSGEGERVITKEELEETLAAEPVANPE